MNTEYTQRQTFFTNQYDRIFTVALLWNIGQPFVCGTLEEVVKYALLPNNGISHFSEITNGKIKKVSKKELKTMLSRTKEKQELSIQLFLKY